MAQLVASTKLTTTYTAYEIVAPDIAVSARPGQIVLVRTAERVAPAPCAITDCDPDKGTVTIVTRARISPAADPSTETGAEASTETAADSPPEITADDQTVKTAATPPVPADTSVELTGPLGRPVDAEKPGKIVCIAASLGVAALLPRLREYKEKGWYTQVIAGYSSRDSVYWTDRLNEFSDELYVVTEDGSLGIKGPIRHTIKAVCEQTADIDRVFAVGPIEVLKATSDVTRKIEMPTWISLNAVFDGNGAAAPDTSDVSEWAAGGTDAVAGPAEPPDGGSAANESTEDSTPVDNQPPPAFDWSAAADLNGHEQDFNALADRLGVQIKK